jgi:hypothetical protein
MLVWYWVSIPAVSASLSGLLVSAVPCNLSSPITHILERESEWGVKLVHMCICRTLPTSPPTPPPHPHCLICLWRLFWRLLASKKRRDFLRHHPEKAGTIKIIHAFLVEENNSAGSVVVIVSEFARGNVEHFTVVKMSLCMKSWRFPPGSSYLYQECPGERIKKLTVP